MTWVPKWCKASFPVACDDKAERVAAKRDAQQKLHEAEDLRDRVEPMLETVHSEIDAIRAWSLGKKFQVG